MDFQTFNKLSKEYNTVPVYKRVLADLLTPISAYLRLSKGCKYSFIFESAESGKGNGRYSFIGRDPSLVIKSENKKTYIFNQGNWKKSDYAFLDMLREIQKKHQAPKLFDLPNFSGGLVGFLGYESVAWVEDIPINNEIELDCPDALFMLCNEIVAFDHYKNQIILFNNVHIEENLDLKEAYKNANVQIDKIGEDLHTDIDYQTPSVVSRSKLTSNFNSKKFKDAVREAKKYIVSGDIFQIVISQRFMRDTSADSITIYRALRSINPSPYMFHLNLDVFQIIGSSPELLVKVEDGEIEIRPIAGTRKRGKSIKEDEELSKELLLDEKERSEHLMLVDLGRNDVGRSADYDTVEVKQFMVVEYYSHVMHIVSDIRGKLKKGKDVFDALYSGFPAGTLTGAPKIRAMEIINFLEPSKRGIYSGAIGYFDFTGNMNTCIAIRTMVMKDNKVYFQSGAGIVYDSLPEKELDETQNKAKAINLAIDLAEKGLLD